MCSFKFTIIFQIQFLSVFLSTVGTFRNHINRFPKLSVWLHYGIITFIYTMENPSLSLNHVHFWDEESVSKMFFQFNGISLMWDFVGSSISFLKIADQSKFWLCLLLANIAVENIEDGLDKQMEAVLPRQLSNQGGLSPKSGFQKFLR